MRILKRVETEVYSSLRGDLITVRILKEQSTKVQFGPPTPRFEFPIDKWNKIWESANLGHVERLYRSSIEEDGPFIYLYKGGFYKSEIHMKSEEVKYFIDHGFRSVQELLDYELQWGLDLDREKGKNRHVIPKDIQVMVWNRDEGRCVKCGTSENLIFTHIIPLSMGGSDTVGNIQLLCESCNRTNID